MTNEELIAALEAACVPSRGLMLEAFAALYPDDGTTDYDDRLFRFVAMLNAEAWRFAALMLKPEGCSVDLSINDDNFSEVALITAHGPICATGSTPALAICIAALKARGEG